MKANKPKMYKTAKGLTHKQMDTDALQGPKDLVFKDIQSPADQIHQIQFAVLIF